MQWFARCQLCEHPFRASSERLDGPRGLLSRKGLGLGLFKLAPTHLSLSLPMSLRCRVSPYYSCWSGKGRVVVPVSILFGYLRPGPAAISLSQCACMCAKGEQPWGIDLQLPTVSSPLLLPLDYGRALLSNSVTIEQLLHSRLRVSIARGAQSHATPSPLGDRGSHLCLAPALDLNYISQQPNGFRAGPTTSGSSSVCPVVPLPVAARCDG